MMSRSVIWSVLAVLVFAVSPAGAATGGGDILFTVEGMASVVFSHDAHVGKAKKRCSECHYGLYTNRAQRKAVGMSGMRSGKSCGACHNGKMAFDVSTRQHCEKCHKQPPPIQ